MFYGAARVNQGNYSFRGAGKEESGKQELRKGISKIEGKATTVGASECGQRASFKAGKSRRLAIADLLLLADGAS
jgi:hypothetical protein